MKKKIFVVCVCVLQALLSITSAAKVTMYAKDGRTIEIAENAVEDYKNVGWYTQPVIKMYAPDGRTVVVAKTAEEEYKSVGWYTQPVVRVYSADGRTQIIAKSAQLDFRKVGWYPEPPVFPSDISVTDFTLYRGQKDVKPCVNIVGKAANVIDYSLISSDTSVVTTQNGLYDGKTIYASVSAAYPFKQGTATLMAVTADGKTGLCRVTVKDMAFYDCGTKNELPDFGYFSGYKANSEAILPLETDGFAYQYENWNTVESYMKLLEGYGWKYCAKESETEYDYYVFSDEQQTRYVVIGDFWQYDTVVIFVA